MDFSNHKKNNTKLISILAYISIIVLLIAIYRLLENRILHTFLVSVPEHDEIGFYNDLSYFLENGWYKSVATGTTPVFNLTAAIIYYYNHNILVSMKWVSILSLTGILLLWSYFIYTHIKLRDIKFVVSVLFLINVGCFRIAYFSGYNDSLYTFFITLGFVLLYKGIYKEGKQTIIFSLSGIAFALALSVREVFVFFVPGLLIIFLIIIVSNRKFLKEVLVWIILFSLTILSIHYPSIKENHKLSTHNKDYKAINVTWAEINYLGLLKNEKQLLRGRNIKLKPLPEEVIEFQKNNGSRALPKTYSEAMFRNPIITIQNFFGLIYLAQLPFMRQLGLLYLFFIVFSMFVFFKEGLLANISKWIPFCFFISYLLCLSIMPIIHLEFRSFMPFTFLISTFAIKYYVDHFRGKPLPDILFYLNFIAIGTANTLLIGVW